MTGFRWVQKMIREKRKKEIIDAFDAAVKDFSLIFEYAKNKEKPKISEEDFYKGYKYYIIDMGAYKNAHVEIPEEHPFFNLAQNGKYNDIPIKAHGGLSFAGTNLLNVVNIDTGKAFIGWDYAHFYDFGKYIDNNEIKEDIKNVVSQLIRIIEND